MPSRCVIQREDFVSVVSVKVLAMAKECLEGREELEHHLFVGDKPSRREPQAVCAIKVRPSGNNVHVEVRVVNGPLDPQVIQDMAEQVYEECHATYRVNDMSATFNVAPHSIHKVPALNLAA